MTSAFGGQRSIQLSYGRLRPGSRFLITQRCRSGNARRGCYPHRMRPSDTLIVGFGFTGTIDAISTAAGPVTISGSGAVTTIIGDAIDVQAFGGTLASPATLAITLSGAITGAATGIDAIQYGDGDILVATSGAVIGLAGRGILAEESSTGVGNVLVDGTGDVTGTRNNGNASGIVAENLNPANTSDVEPELLSTKMATGPR